MTAREAERRTGPSPRARGRAARLLLGTALACLVHPAAAAPASAGDAGRCIVVDSDAGLDDFRAVAALAPLRRVAAVVVTEGIARPAQGAGAMEALLGRAGLSVPVVPGAGPDPSRRHAPDPGLEADWRPNAERLNGILPAPVLPAVPTPGDIAAALRPLVAGCAGISLLVIGPWTSFVRYAPELVAGADARVDRIVAQGRPHQDEPGGGPAGFNCVYDRDACYAAFDLLAGRRQRAGRPLRADWVDIPSGPEACGRAEPGVDARGRRLHAFRPVEEWADDLERVAARSRAGGGAARAVAEVLRANPGGLARTSLWDDLVALYLLRPDLFVVRGGHLEPCVPATTVRDLLGLAMAGQAPEPLP